MELYNSEVIYEMQCMKMSEINLERLWNVCHSASVINDEDLLSSAMYCILVNLIIIIPIFLLDVKLMTPALYLILE